MMISLCCWHKEFTLGFYTLYLILHCCWQKYTLIHFAYNIVSVRWKMLVANLFWTSPFHKDINYFVNASLSENREPDAYLQRLKMPSESCELFFRIAICGQTKRQSMFSFVYKDISYECGYYNLRKTQSHLQRCDIVRVRVRVRVRKLYLKSVQCKNNKTVALICNKCQSPTKALLCTLYTIHIYTYITPKTKDRQPDRQEVPMTTTHSATSDDKRRSHQRSLVFGGNKNRLR